MPTNPSVRDIERLLSEADELAQQTIFDVLNEVEEECRLQSDIHARNLEKMKFEVKDGNENKNEPKTGTYAEGMHAAILDIVKAMDGLKKFLS